MLISLFIQNGFGSHSLIEVGSPYTIPDMIVKCFGCTVDMKVLQKCLIHSIIQPELLRESIEIFWSVWSKPLKSNSSAGNFWYVVDMC